MPAIVPPLTTRARIESRIGQLGADLRIDDDSLSLDDVIADATTEAKGYVSRLYSDDALASSNWIELKVRDIAAYFLCLRRLNDAPPSAKLAYDKAIADLEKIQSGETQIPDAAMTKQAAPVLTNQRLRLWPFPNIVNVPSRSTGNPEGYYSHDDPTDVDPLL
ncbi:phage protein Gp36 family protein [Zavarzinella formosa]|uniref:phage protein Gp36 family protein n=1 Tax=Zavarzinella formosa TaxID=360055 RepID=UPI00031E7B18|nr:phage protein Gp36 family protein [Zavarzinella formosa]